MFVITCIHNISRYTTRNADFTECGIDLFEQYYGIFSIILSSVRIYYEYLH